MRWATRQHAQSIRDERRSIRDERRSTWHRWFAWRPVVMKNVDACDQWVWLEYVERKRSHGPYGLGQFWRYRPVGARRGRRDAYDDAHESAPSGSAKSEKRPYIN